MKKIFYFLMLSFPVYAQFNAPDFDGFWRGKWFNNTFQSTDSAFVTIHVNSAAGTLQIIMDLNGNVFGGSDPEAAVLNGTYNNNGFTVTGNSATYGDIFFSGDANGNLTGRMPNVPSPFVDSTTLSGKYNPDSMNVVYLIFSGGAQFANGVINVKKDKTTDVSDAASAIPDFHLYQNYPNPYNPSTNIEFGIAGSGFVRLKVFDILGKEVATLISKEMPAGEYKIQFDASSVGGGLPSGIYIYKLEAGGYVSSRKMIVMK